MVARAIFSSPVPVVSGVGHETDWSISDLVADVRASTPTTVSYTHLTLPTNREV